MKVLFISEYYLPKIMGGGEINLSLIAESLVHEGVEVFLLTSFHPELKIVEKINGVKIYRTLITGDSPEKIFSNFKRSFSFPRSIAREIKIICKKHKFDLIHFIGTSLIAALELKRLNIPLFATIESYPSLCPKGDRMYCGKKECKKICSFNRFICCQLKSSEIGKNKNKWFLKYNLPLLICIYRFYKKLNSSLNYCHLIAISKYVQGILKQHQCQSAVISNIIDAKPFYSKKRNWKELRILYLGSLTKYKGPQILLKSLKGLKNYHCHLYGEGPLKKKLQKIIERYNLKATIHAPVPYNQVPELYAETDLIVFPSLWPEPFGRISIEAMAAGKLVIGSDIGGIKETILNKELLSKPGNEKELRELIKKQALDFSKKESGKELNKYSKKKIIKKIINLYQNNKKFK